MLTLSLSSLVSNILFNFLDNGLFCWEDALEFAGELSAAISIFVSAIVLIILHVNFRELFWSNCKKRPTEAGSKQVFPHSSANHKHVCAV